MNAFTSTAHPTPLLRQDAREQPISRFWRNWARIGIFGLVLLEANRVVFSVIGLSASNLVVVPLAGVVSYAIGVHVVGLCADIVLANLNLRSWRDGLYLAVALTAILGVGAFETYVHLTALTAATTGRGLADSIRGDLVTLNGRALDIDRAQTQHFHRVVAETWRQADQSKAGRDGTGDARCGERCAASQVAARQMSLKYATLDADALVDGPQPSAPVADASPADLYESLRRNIATLETRTQTYLAFCREAKQECRSDVAGLRESPEYARVELALGQGVSSDRSALVRARVHEQLAAAVRGDISADAAIHLIAAAMPSFFVLVLVGIVRLMRLRMHSLRDDIELARTRMAETDEMFKLELRNSVDQAFRRF